GKSIRILLRGDPLNTSQPVPFPVVTPQVDGRTSGRCQVVLPASMHAESVTESAAHRQVELTDVDSDRWDVIAKQEMQLPRQFDTHVTEFRWGTGADVLPDRIRIVPVDEGEEESIVDMMSDDVVVPMPTDADQAAESTARVDQASPFDDDQPVAIRYRLDVTAVLAARGAPAHMQRSVYRFATPTSVQRLQLKLAKQCSVSSVRVDGESVRILRRGEEISFPELIPPARWLEVISIVPADERGLLRSIQLPLPSIEGSAELFEWHIEVPAGYALEPVQWPAAVTSMSEQPDLPTRVLGPLARGRSADRFHPFRKEDWYALWQPSDVSNTVSLRGSELQVLALAPPPILELRCWDKTQLRTLSWVALLACGLIGVSIRMWSLRLLRNLSIPWLALMVTFALLLPAALSSVAGGAFVGSLLSLLLPRRLVQRVDLLGEIQSGVEPSSVTVGVGAAVLLMIMFLPGVSAQSPGKPSAITVRLRGSNEEGWQPFVRQAVLQGLEKQRQRVPASLVRSASYVAEHQESGLQVRAEYLVDVIDAARADSVRLPLAQVVFPQGAACHVDGVPASFIPAGEGDAVIVTFPDGEAAPNGEEQSPEDATNNEGGDSEAGGLQTLRRVQLQFSIRPDELGRFRAKIPQVIQSTWQETPEMPAGGPSVRFGVTRELQDRIRVTSLGRIAELIWSSEQATTAESLPVVAETVLQLTPLNLSADSVLKIPQHSAHQLLVEFPPQAVVRQVTGAAVAEWAVVRANARHTLVNVTLLEHSATDVHLVYELIPRVTQGKVVVPPLPLLTDGLSRHDVGLMAAPGLVLGPVQGLGKQPLELIAQGERSPRLQAPGIAQAIRLTGPATLNCPISSQPLESSVAVDVRCRVQKSQVDWEARIAIQTNSLPQFVYRMTIPTEWGISDAKLDVMGALQTVRWERKGADLTVFLTEEGLDEPTILVSGTRSLITENWLDLLRVELPGATVREQSWAVLDETEWIVEVETSGGSVLATPAAQVSTASPTTAEKAVPVAQLLFRSGGAVEPRRLRLVPTPSAALATSVTLLQAGSDGTLRLVTTSHVDSVDAPLRRVVSVLPAHLADSIEVRPATLRHSLEPVDESQSRLILYVPTRLRESVTYSVSYDVAEEDLVEYGPPLPQLTSATTGDRLLLLDAIADLRLAPGSGIAIQESEVPAWLPSTWRLAIRDRQLLCYRLTGNEIKFSRREHVVQDARLPWCEHLIWPQADGTIVGQTQLWGEGRDPLVLDLRLPPHLVITRVQSMHSDATLLPEDEENVHRRVAVAPRDGLIELTIDWRATEDARDVVAVPQVGPLLPEVSLLGIVTGKNRTVRLEPGLQAVMPSQVWLDRWQGLLACVGEVPQVLKIDSLIMQRIRKAQREAGESVSPTKGEQERYQELMERWSEVQSQLVIDAGQAGASSDETDPVATILELDDPTVQWLTVTAPVVSVDLVPSSTLRERTFVWWLLAIITLVATVAKLVVDRLQLRDRLAIRPALGVMLLGSIWWGWLFPSVLGCALFALGLALLIYEFARPEAADVETL
ncbi:MAG: hypothetical protein KDA58_11565, partial [Planctomycetaceae bacterium]|nr:hypothetical protein [Planctomycetaceae bacterium]